VEPVTSPRLASRSSLLVWIVPTPLLAIGALLFPVEAHVSLLAFAAIIGWSQLASP
jgi:hypothetical protein